MSGMFISQGQHVPLCDHPEETVDHHLFYCAPLADLRSRFLPPQLDNNKKRYGTSKQLMNTCKYHYIVITMNRELVFEMVQSFYQKCNLAPNAVYFVGTEEE